MKKERIILLIVIIISLIGISYTLILEKNIIAKNNKHIIKEMTESTQITDLNNQINSLNAEHTEYMNYKQTCKAKIATALTNEGVTTSNQVTLETMAGNISKVLQVRTSNATATADNITQGKTAYVNGKLIVGTALDYTSNPKLIWQNSYSASSATFPAQTLNLDLSNYDAIIISLIRVHTSTTRWYFVIPIGTSQVVNMYMHGDETTIGGNTWYRLITTSENSIIFGNPLNDSSCNYGMLPCEIYGLNNLF